MAVKKGSKNNIANRGKGAKIKQYNGKAIKPVKLINNQQGTTFIAAQYEGGELVMDPAGSFVKYAAVVEEMQDVSKPA
jgi:ribosomal protein L27